MHRRFAIEETVSPSAPAPTRRRPAARSPRRPGPRASARRRHRRLEQLRTASRCRCLEAVVAAAYGTDLAALRSASRGHADIAFARQVAMYVAHVWFGLSLSEVGRHFGRDRTTVAHACHVVEERRDDPGVDRVIAAVETAADLWIDFATALEASR